MRLRSDKVRRDHFGRTLAHLETLDGTNISEALLREGLCASLVMPPNLQRVAQYASAETLAREAGKGIWSLPQHQPRAAGSIKPSDKGLSIIHGCVTKVDSRRYATLMQLDRHLYLKTDATEHDYFSSLPLPTLRGRCIEVRGELYEYKNQSRLRLRHPTQISILP